MPLSGGRSSVRGAADLSAVPPLILELAGLKQDNGSSGRMPAGVSSGVMDRKGIEMPVARGV